MALDARYLLASTHAELGHALILGVQVIGAGATDARPEPSTPGALYYDRDTGILYRDSGDAWEPISARPLAQGDIIVGGPDGTPMVLPIGDPWTVLMADPTAPGGVSWQEIPANKLLASILAEVKLLREAQANATRQP